MIIEDHHDREREMTSTEATSADAQAPPKDVELTMLNVMGGADFEASVARHREWGLRWMDLKNAIYGNDLKDLSLEDAQKATRLLEENGLEVYCFSTVLLGGDVTAGEEGFAAQDLADLEHILRLAEILQPRFVRLLGAQLPGREAHENAIAYVERELPWVLPAYRAAIDRIVSAGYAATIENEAWSCMLSSTEEFRSFFTALDRPGSVSLTWDAQNQWATGVMPTVAIYEELRELIAYYHVKGGKSESRDGSLGWNVALDEATWPVAEVTQRIVDDGASPVICLNPPGHGKAIDGYPYGDAVTERDLAYLRTQVDGVR
jgi:sugar phosphate isomerase/epimerase